MSHCAGGDGGKGGFKRENLKLFEANSFVCAGHEIQSTSECKYCEPNIFLFIIICLPIFIYFGGGCNTISSYRFMVLGRMRR